MLVLTMAVMLPVGTPPGIPEVTPSAPRVGRGDVGSMDHPVAVDAGHDPDVIFKEAAY